MNNSNPHSNSEHPIRKRASQTGIQNTPKPGFYSRHFKDMEGFDLNNTSVGLVDEIALMRVMIRRVFEAAENEEIDLDDWSQLLGTLGLATTRLARLLKVQQTIAGGNVNEIAAALSEALKDITKELEQQDTVADGVRQG